MPDRYRSQAFSADTRQVFRSKVFQAAVGVVLAASALAGCASSGGAPASPAGSGATSPQPTDPGQVDDGPEYVAFPSALQPLADLADLTEFAAEDKDLLRQYGAFIASNPMETNLGITLADFESSYAEESENPIDLLPTASKSNTAQEVLQVSGANMRYAFALSGIDRQKYLIAMLQYGIDSDAYKTVAPKFDEHPGNVEGWTLAVKGDLPIGSATESSGVQESDGSAGIVADRITYVSAEDGKTYEQVFYYNEVDLPDGNSFAIWFL